MNPCGCLQKILKDVECTDIPAKDNMVDYWRDFMTPVIGGSPGVDVPSQEIDLKSVWASINHLKIKAAFPSHGTAPGPDGLRVKLLKSTVMALLTRVFNNLLYVERLPAYLLESRTTLIPKKQKPEPPGDFGLITVSSVLTQTFNKIVTN